MVELQELAGDGKGGVNVGTSVQKGKNTEGINLGQFGRSEYDAMSEL